MHFAVLSLFCNRLTIDALLKTATRISGPIKDQSIEATNETSKQLAKGILGRGKDRTIFLLELSVEKAQMTLNGDDGLQVALLIQQNFSFNLSVSFLVIWKLSNVPLSVLLSFLHLFPGLSHILWPGNGYGQFKNL